MKRLLIKFFQKIGIYKFRTILKSSTRQEVIRPKISNKYIEFIGPSGIGKSTLFYEIKELMVGDWNYNEQIDPVTLMKNDDEFENSFHWELLVKKLKNLEKKEINTFQQIQLMKYFTEVVFRDFVMLNGFYEKGFLLEEGLCHNFAEELAELSEPEFVNLMAGRAIIYLIPRKSTTVVKRLRKREIEGGHVVTHHVGLNNNQLKEITEVSLVNFEKLVSKAKLIGVPICRIFAEDDLSHNRDLVLCFEQEIISFRLS
ncbi:MAG: hypothetical protein AB4041_21005 [Microcystaceae cyanobacterium]